MGQNIQAKFDDKQNEIRLAIMNFIIDHKRPFHMKHDGYDALKGISLSGRHEFEDILETLHTRDGFSADEEENINFIYPVSALPTAHLVTLEDGREFSAMCAIDAIGSTFTFHQDTQIHSSCSVCGNEIYVKMKDGTCVEHSPKGLHALSFCLEEISNWAGSCWNAMNFFCTENEFNQYALEMKLDMETVIKADINLAVKEARETFFV